VQAIAVLLAASSARAQSTTTLISYGPSGASANGASLDAFISPDGGFVAFSSEASDLVAGDSNGMFDVFVRDVTTGAITCCTRSPAGAASDADSQAISLSSQARFVVFTSSATNLVAGDTNAADDVFAFERATGTVRLLSHDPNGAPGDGASHGGQISADARYVAFVSLATQLVPNDTNGVQDAFVHDRLTDSIERVSVSSSGAQADDLSYSVALSLDGRFVAIESRASNLDPSDQSANTTDVFVRDRVLATTMLISRSSGGVQDQLQGSHNPLISADGRFVAFESFSAILAAPDTNHATDVFIRDVVTGTTELASVGAGNVQSEPFTSSRLLGLSQDGRWIAFSSASANFAANDGNGVADVFLRDRVAATTARISVAGDGSEGDGASNGARGGVLSLDATRVALVSHASNFDAGDANGASDVFLFDATPGAPRVYCTAKASSAGCVPAMSSSGAPSASSPSSFVVAAAQVLNQKPGLLFYGLAASAAPFHGGQRCVATPIRRTHAQSSNGNPPPDDCSGAYAFDFNAHIRAGVDPALVVGAFVYCQYWSRDPASPGKTGLTDGLVFAIGP
jgi:Tol biopolymer transport system component